MSKFTSALIKAMTALMMMALLIILRLARLTVDPVKVVNTVTDMFGGFILLFTITCVLGAELI